MVVSEVVGVGILLTPATMMRTVGSVWPSLMVWVGMGVLSAAGALCYAELATRFPRMGGGYVFLREAFGQRSAFVYGWMALLVIDPGLTAALGIGLAQYLLATFGASARHVPAVAVIAIAAFGLLTVWGINASAHVMRWTAAAKLAIVLVLVGAAVIRAGSGDAVGLATGAAARINFETLAASIIAAFFAFGGWWELGRMSEEVAAPQRTMPLALIAGLALVTIIYACVSLAYVMTTSNAGALSDEAFVSTVGRSLFGDSAGRLLAAMVVVAVSGSLAAVLLSAPRVYLALARDGLFPPRLARFDAKRGALPGLTALQVILACVLVLLGTFNQILGYFVPVAVFFLGLSASAVLVLPRPANDAHVFRAPLHPLPILVFLVLIVVVLLLFAIGQPRQTLLGAIVVALGIPVSGLVLPTRVRAS